MKLTWDVPVRWRVIRCVAGHTSVRWEATGSTTKRTVARLKAVRGDTGHAGAR